MLSIKSEHSQAQSNASLQRRVVNWLKPTEDELPMEKFTRSRIRNNMPDSMDLPSTILGPGAAVPGQGAMVDIGADRPGIVFGPAPPPAPAVDVGSLPPIPEQALRTLFSQMGQEPNVS